MSHISSATTKIENPDLETLRTALEKLAERLGAKMIDVNELKDYYGNRLVNTYPNIAFALKGGDLNYGVGIEVTEDGEVNIRGDFWNSSTDQNLFANQFEEEFYKEAVSESLVEKGFDITSIDEEENEIVIYGEDMGWGL